MRFLFVDGITERSATRICGYRHFGVSDPMQYSQAFGEPEVASGALCEGIGQLASWLCLEQNQFSGRPVFLFADKIDIFGSVPVGVRVDLSADIHTMDAESFRFSGEASVDGELKQRLVDCSGMFMPLANLEDPEVARSRFAALTTGGLQLEDTAAAPYPFASLPGEVLRHEVGKEIHARRQFASSEPFFRDHFPRFPVTPIVMLNEMIGQTTLRMLSLGAEAKLRPLAVSRVKIRSFVAPGDFCDTVITTPGVRVEGGRKLLTTTAELLKDGRRILRGDYHYEVTG